MRDDELEFSYASINSREGDQVGNGYDGLTRGIIKKYGTGNPEPQPQYAYQQPLTWDETVFLDCLFSNGMDVRAARRAAGIGQKVHASTILSRPHIIQAIHERMKYEKVGVPETLEMIAKLARADVRDFYKVEEWDERTTETDEDGVEHVTIIHHKRAVPDLVKAIERGDSYAIKGVEHNRDGSVKKFMIEDRAPYIDKLCEILGLTNRNRMHPKPYGSFLDRLRDSGMNPRTVMREMKALMEEMQEASGEIFDATGESDE